MNRSILIPWRSVAMLALAIGGLRDMTQADESPRPISVPEALKKIDQAVYVELTVKAAKDRLEQRGEIFLDSEDDFHDEKNLGTVITRDGAAALRRRGIADPAEHFRGKRIRVRGTVIIKEKRPRIEVDESQQIELIREL